MWMWNNTFRYSLSKHEEWNSSRCEILWHISRTFLRKKRWAPGTFQEFEWPGQDVIQTKNYVQMIHALLYVYLITLVRIGVPTIIVVCLVNVISIVKLILCDICLTRGQINIARRTTRRWEVQEEASACPTREHSHFRTNVLADAAAPVADPIWSERWENPYLFYAVSSSITGPVVARNLNSHAKNATVPCAVNNIRIILLFKWSIPNTA